MNNSKEQGGMTEPASDTPTQHAEGGVEENESEPIKNTNEDHVESDSSKTIVEEQNKVSEQDEANNDISIGTGDVKLNTASPLEDVVLEPEANSCVEETKAETQSAGLGISDSKQNKEVVIPEEEEDDDEDVFSNLSLGKRKLSSADGSQSRKKHKIVIKMHRENSPGKKHVVLTNLSEDELPDLTDESEFPFGTSAFTSDIVPEMDDLSDSAIETALEAALAFYAETHEDQDPRVIELMKQRERNNCQKELEQIALEDQVGRRDIKEVVTVQLKEKQASANRNIERLRAKADAEEQKDLQRLQQAFSDKNSLNSQKIAHGVKLLSRRHTQDLQKQAHQHRLNAQQRGVPEQMMNAEWAQIAQKIQEKQRRQLQEFNVKGEEVKKKCEQDYLKEQEKRRIHHEKRKKEMELGMKKVVARMHQNFQLQHQRYLKRHVLRINKKKEEILARMNPDGKQSKSEKDDSSGKDVFSTKNEVRKELQTPQAIKSSMYAADIQDENEEKAAAARHKHRKAILTTVPKQLGIEIHNEGLWIAPIIEKSPDESKRGTEDNDESTSKNENAEFIPWGLKARELLHEIVCGEIPVGYGPDRFDFGDTLTLNSGFLRCVVTDLRTGETTASQQRAECAKAQEEEALQVLESKVAQLTNIMTEADRNLQKVEAQEKEATVTLEKTLKDVEKAKKMLHEFLAKYGRYFEPDGQPIKSANPSDQQKLAQASHRYKTNVETAEKKEIMARKALADIRGNVQKMQGIAKQAQKATTSASTLLRKRKALIQEGSKSFRNRLSETAESERASSRVTDVISSFKKTAERRRDQLSQKRSSSASSTWVQGLPGVPGPLKKSLWHKMHRRRRQQIVLRPSVDMMVQELRERVGRKRSKKPVIDVNDDPVVRAEQLFLLAMHPLSPDHGALPNVPSTTTTDPWAEPGWQLVLNVAKDDHMHYLLPRPPNFPLAQKNQSEVCSAPGRQAASFFRTIHMRALSAPLTAVAQAISLAETNPLITGESEYAENDPLNISDEAMSVGYEFSLKPPAKAVTTPSRRKSAPKDNLPQDSTAIRKNADDIHSIQIATAPQQHAKSKSGRRSPSAVSQSSSQSGRKTAAKGESSRRRSSNKKQKTSSAEVAPRGPTVDQQQPQVAPSPVSQQTSHAQQQVTATTILAQQQMGMLYPSQGGTPQQVMDPQQQYGQQYLQQVQPPPLTPQGQHGGHSMQQLQPQQLQQGMQPQQHLLPQPPHQYASPQQQAYQQRQMQMQRMIQQQQGRQSYPQGQQLQFFAPAIAQRQGSFGHISRGVAPPGVLQHPSPHGRRGSHAGNIDDQNDPLNMLNDMGGPK